MIAIIDYGVGNLFSLRSSLESLSAEVVVSGDEQVISAADELILPGVGAFEDAARKLKDTGLDTLIKGQAAKKKPILGICLGMQLLFERRNKGQRSHTRLGFGRILCYLDMLAIKIAGSNGMSNGNRIVLKINSIPL